MVKQKGNSLFFTYKPKIKKESISMNYKGTYSPSVFLAK